jgi:Tol biopolymer transport system component
MFGLTTGRLMDALLYHPSGPELWLLSPNRRSETDASDCSLSGRIDQAQFSPDGHWIAYQTNESGSQQIVVIPLPPTGDKWQISTAGGVQPTWRADGRELYFLTLDATMMAVDIHPEKHFE